MLEGYGLHTFTWGLSDERPSELLVASPADARGRGILLKVSQSGAAQSLVGARAYLLWRHRVTGRRGCEPMEALDASAGRWRVYYPAAMQESEGAVDAQLMLSWDDRSLSTRVFQIRVEPSIVGGTQSRDGFTLFVDAIKRYEDGAALVGEATREASEAAAAAVRAREDLEAAAARGDFDGAEGRPGRDGADGRDGVSPTARVEQTESGATITVTDASGTTSVDLTRGVRGDDGRDGADATIVGASATVDGGSGTPSVDVAMGGTPSARTLSFSFHNLRGERGQAGPQGPAGPSGTAADLEPYATKEYVDAAIAALANLDEREY